MKHAIIILSCLSLLICCKSTSNIDNSISVLEDESVNLYAFIGKKISVKEFHLENSVSTKVDSTGDTLKYVNVVMDHAFNAKYKVLKNVFNKLPSNIVKFKVFDHYGKPAFRKYRYVMLYISLDKKEGVYYHQKYQFDPVKKSKNGTWKGLKGESIEALFNKKREGILSARGVFN